MTSTNVKRRWFESRSNWKHRCLKARYEEEEFEDKKRRMTVIKTICDHEMKKAQLNGHFPVRETIVVDYSTLLKIWDIADREIWS